MRIISTLAVLFVSVATFGADVTAVPHSNDHPTMLGVIIKGDIAQGDTAKLRAIVTSSVKRDLVVLIQSDGGQAVEGVALHTYLTSLHGSHSVSTSVVDGGIAASAAAMAWAAGEQRHVGEGGMVLFHLPFMPEQAGQPVKEIDIADVTYMSLMMTSMGKLGEVLANACLAAQQEEGSHILVGITTVKGETALVQVNTSTKDVQVIK